MPATGETERAPNVGKAVWEGAGERAKSEGLPLIWVMSRALTDYASGTLPLPHTTTGPEAGPRRGRTVFASDIIWNEADKRRSRDKVRSMSALCEILLSAYARGEIHPYARMVTTAQRDGLKQTTPTPAAA
ncbi:hypothetical protein [Streptomyces sp. 11x1]|uniref:hypothetical protein n=1 Tax=Streptomyces sp. 11x1 TaxID=3038642 RepID=UPI00292FE2B6|nr:hypothetical protein [Streptomyces sp. 11x1]WNZ14864.1 hypothetical protein P8T65_33985 [Streptomyces sp. 11x1]